MRSDAEESRVTVSRPPQPEQLTIDEDLESWHDWFMQLRDETIRELGLEPDEREGEAA
jgi:hypothetical protein